MKKSRTESTNKTIEKLIVEAAQYLKRYHSSAEAGSSTLIAKNAGCSQPNINWHFKTVENLYCEAVDWLRENDEEGYKKVVTRELADEASFIHKHLEDALPW